MGDRQPTEANTYLHELLAIGSMEKNHRPSPAARTCSWHLQLAPAFESGHHTTKTELVFQLEFLLIYLAVWQGTRVWLDFFV